ncbi:MAG: hypothetical protein ACRDV9_03925 [Acidimicrobiia bacterium]
MGTALQPPQLIVDARMVYLVWVPADPDSVAKLVPEALTPAADRAVYLNQYVVDDDRQISNTGQEGAFGSYSITYLGADLAGLDATADIPGRWWIHYFNSSEPMRRYAKAHGVPVGEAAQTTLELDGGVMVATTVIDGSPIIRTRCRTEVGTTQRATGQLRYITALDGQLMSGRYPFVANLAEHFEVLSVEFLEPSHPLYQLRPADPLQITFGFYSPAISFCYPGGEGPLGTALGA